MIQYKLETFEGPLDLLLSLVAKHKLDISDIPIDLLCEQYMAYIKDAEEHDVALACEFLLMASELMLIKSRMLLPRDPASSEDPRKPLVDALIEYQRAKLAAGELSDLFRLYGGRTAKEQDDVSPDRTYVADHAVDLLRAALVHVFTETKFSEKTVREEFSGIVNAPRIPVEDVIARLIGGLREKSADLEDYFRRSESRAEVIAKFIGILELLKFHIIELRESITEENVTDVYSHAEIVLIATDEEIAAAQLESNDY